MGHTDAIRDRFWVHPITVTEPGHRTAMGTKPGVEHTVNGSIKLTNQVVTDQHGQNVTVTGVAHWAANGPLPTEDWTITLPPEFGVRPNLQVVTARRALNGGIAPEYTEVTFK